MILVSEARSGQFLALKIALALCCAQEAWAAIIFFKLWSRCVYTREICPAALLARADFEHAAVSDAFVLLFFRFFVLFRDNIVPKK